MGTNPKFHHAAHEAEQVCDCEDVLREIRARLSIIEEQIAAPPPLTVEAPAEPTRRESWLARLSKRIGVRRNGN